MVIMMIIVAYPLHDVEIKSSFSNWIESATPLCEYHEVKVTLTS